MTDMEIEILLVEDNTSDAELTIRALHKKHIANNIIHLQDGAMALDFLLAPVRSRTGTSTTGQRSSCSILKCPKWMVSKCCARSKRRN
ncbi:MAG TPA: hypothetical protein PLK54_11660 [Ferruginibacter sp.]|nr:hypothetical protein [Ferruginibacter sp.]HNG64406.1 hypothetical protein [Ferruginibacter sp.]